MQPVNFVNAATEVLTKVVTEAINDVKRSIDDASAAGAPAINLNEGHIGVLITDVIGRFADNNADLIKQISYKVAQVEADHDDVDEEHVTRDSAETDEYFANQM